MKKKLTTEELQEVLDDLLTLEDLQEMFGVSHQTIYIWRRDHGLPTINVPGRERNTIRAVKEDIIDWANKYGKRYRDI